MRMKEALVKTQHLYATARVVVMVFLMMFLLMPMAAADEYPTLHRGVRPLGMGGAFTAVADDENALFYNPAGLSDISTVQVGIVNPLVEVSKNTLDFVNDIQDADLDDTGEVADLLRDYLGEHQHVRAALYPHVGLNIAGYGVMIGALAQATLDAEVHNPVWPELDADFVRDLGLLGGVGANLPLSGLRIGAALKYIDRESLSETYDAVDIASDDFEDQVEDDYKSGSGVGLDLGAIYRLPFVNVVDLDVGLALLNIPKMSMGDAKDLETEVNLGIAAKRGLAGFDLIGAVDFIDLTHNHEADPDNMKRLHMGLELQFPAVLAVRAGINQGYLTAGATLDFWVLRLDAATYAEEVGSYAGQKEDRRYIGQISIGW